jgi:hypothetical protein
MMLQLQAGKGRDLTPGLQVAAQSKAIGRRPGPSQDGVSTKNSVILMANQDLSSRAAAPFMKLVAC